MEQWKIHKDRQRCEKPSCPLPVEQEFYAVLQLPDCLRHELCQQCFHQLRESDDSLPFHWKVRRGTGGKKEAVLDLESLRMLFDRLGEPGNSSENAAGLRYLVALLLLRKRRLKMVDATTPEQEAADMLVLDPKVEGMEPVALQAPDLDADRLANLREELMAALGDESESDSPGAAETADS